MTSLCFLSCQNVVSSEAVDLYIVDTVDQVTGAEQAMKPEATAIGRSARWPLENNLNF